MENKNVAVVVLNYVQFYNIKPIIDDLLKQKVLIDIYVPYDQSESNGFDTMFDDVYQYIVQLGYSVIREYDEQKEYKVLLESYPMIPIKAEYRMKYKYGMLCAKPDVVYDPYQLLVYDVIFCNGPYEQNYMRVFSNAVIGANVKYAHFKKKKHEGKPILLYLPTYGEVSSLDTVVKELGKLKKDYQIMVKLHHGTQFLNTEKERVDSIYKNCDSVYDSHTELAHLFETADVVLSDNSGAIFESLYVNVPVVIFSNDPNHNKKEGFNTTQYELIQEGIIDYTDKIENLPNILKQALSESYKEKQTQKAKEMFYYTDDATKNYVDTIMSYLNDAFDHRYYEMHQILKHDYYHLHDIIYDKEQLLHTYQSLAIENVSLLEKQQQLEKENEALSQICHQQKQELYYFNNGKLYKAAHKLYVAKEKVGKKHE